MSKLAADSTFALEASELLTRIEDAALTLETDPADRDGVHLLFRAFHTLKGSAAMVGLSEIASFTHHMENALDRVRDGRLQVSASLIGLVLAAKDCIERLLTCAIEGGKPDEEESKRLIAQLGELSAHASVAPPASAAAVTRMRTTYSVYFRLSTEDATLNIAPADLIEELKKLGTVEAKEVAGAEANRSAAWEVTLTAEGGEDAIRDVFMFAPHGSELRIEPGLSEFVTEPPPPPAAPPPPAPIEREPAAAKPAPRKAAARAQETIRVSSERLDQLMKLVGEMVINQSRLQQVHATLRAPELTGPVEAMERLIGELRDRVFGVRMMPIGPTFARFKRLARDLSTQLGKEIELVTTGDETELDKNVLEQLADPLVHIIRNSMDHGLEAPAVREANGKPRKGKITLSAAHDSGQVVITVSDDGRGLDKQAIRAKAIEKGLVDAHTTLSEQETIELILRPGFSTAQALTQLSGRGVGLDVVKKTIESLRGSLSIASEFGAGTTIRLSLPLTLAIVEGLVVEVAGLPYIVPMAAVIESVEITRAERQAHNGRPALALRGELVPYIRVRALFGEPLQGPDVEMVVIVSVANQRIGLLLDRVLGLHQTVIQPLGPFCREVSLFSGFTIMGDGKVVLIFDLASMVQAVDAGLLVDMSQPMGRRRDAGRKAEHSWE